MEYQNDSSKAAEIYNFLLNYDIMVQNTKHSNVDGLSQKQTTNKRDGNYQHVSHFTTVAANHYMK